MAVRGSPRQARAMKSRFPLSLVLWMASASCSAQIVAVRLYDHAGLSGTVASRLTESADRAFGHSGIHVIWRYCGGMPTRIPERTCQSDISFNEIVVSLETTRAHNSSSRASSCMGHASVSPAGGYSASVFVPTVREQAAGFGVGFDLLIGYAVAHEVGHCLLGPGHSYAGLMRGVWNRKDAEEIARVSLHLTSQERRKAVARIAWLNQGR